MSKSNGTKFYRLRRSFWREEKTKQIVSQGPTVALVAIHLLSSPRGNMAGIFECPLTAISKALALTVPEVKDAITVLKEINFLKYSDDEEYVWVISMAEDELGQNPSPQQVKGMISLLESLDANELAPFASELSDIILSNPIYHDKMYPKVDEHPLQQLSRDMGYQAHKRNK